MQQEIPQASQASGSCSPVKQKMEYSPTKQVMSAENKISQMLLENECCSDIKQKLKVSIAECSRLKNVIKEITDVNKKWQKYNQERQVYLQQLLASFQELQEKSNSLNPKDHLLKKSVTEQTNSPVVATCGSYRHSDSSLLSKQEQHLTLKQSYEKVVRDNCRLQKEQQEMHKNFEALAHQLDLVRNERKEHQEVLDMQVRAYREDWEAEKREKEEAKMKVTHLTEELNTAGAKNQNYRQRIKQIEKACQCSFESPDESHIFINGYEQAVELGQLHQWKSSNTSVPSSRQHKYYQKEINTPQKEPVNGKIMINQTHYNNVPCNAHASEPHENIDIGTNLKDLMETSNLEVDADVSHKKKTNSPTKTNNMQQTNSKVYSQGSSDEDGDVVECPGCLRTFPSHRHVQFLDHFEQCQNLQVVE
ncbi:testis-specific gene 10 protein-like isoform X2 [Limulus polyphemus]|nr:testis-specific gene 10 protein-like isoform X2 [Limulus polyphemus]